MQASLQSISEQCYLELIFFQHRLDRRYWKMNVQKSTNYAFNKRENAVVRTTIKKRNCFLTTARSSVSSELTNTHLHPPAIKPEYRVENNSSSSSPLSKTDPRFSKRLLQGSVSKTRETSQGFTSSPMYIVGRATSKVLTEKTLHHCPPPWEIH